MEKKKKLSFEEVHQVVKSVRFGCYGVTTKSKHLFRDRSTITRTIQRLKDLERQRPAMRSAETVVVARCLYEEKLLRRIKARGSRIRLKTKEIQVYVESRLKGGWTTIAICGRLCIDKPGLSISPESIYQWIYSERPELKVYLPIAGKCRRRRQVGKRNRKPRPVSHIKKSIETRPEEACKRQRIGDFEVDAILWCRGAKSALQVLVDRRMRKVFLQKVSNLEAQQYTESLKCRIQADIPVIHTITSDNGPEHAGFHQVESCFNIEWFFCHPYCSSERGTVENRNRAIRRFFPKGTNFDEATTQQIAEVENYINNYPLKVLDFLTPNQAWNLELEKIKLAA